MSETMDERHPSFLRAESLPAPWRAHFPKSTAEAQVWRPLLFRHALATRVLVVATTRIECTWAAYCDAVPGQNHHEEADGVLERGAKLSEDAARALFPRIPLEVPYAD